MTQRVWRVLLAVGFLCTASFGSSASWAQSCGVERWSVKTGTDADVGKINLSTTTSQLITTMRGWTAPNPIPANNRVTPYETTVWVLDATLTKYKKETDSDYHLVLSDAAGNTLIGEIPLPGCVGTGSPLLSKITSARAEFDAKLTATSSFQTVSIPVRITGVGMFDFLHGQTGVAPNGIEIHPILDIVFNPTSSPDFTIAASPAAVSAAQGASVNTTVTTAVSGGFNSAVALSVSGLPTGASATFTPTSIAAPGAGSSTLKLSAGTAATGTYNLTVTGTGGGKTHTAAVSFTVTGTASPDFTLAASPAAVSAAQGSSVSTTVTTAVSGGFNSAIALSVSGLPTGASAIFTPTSIAAPGSGSSTLQLTAGSAATGTYNLTVTGTGGGKTHTAAVSFTITATASPDFALAVSPASLSVATGSTGTATATTTVSGGFSSAVALSVSGLPTGASGSFSPTSIAAPGAGSSTLTITTGTAAAGTYSLTVTATGGGKTHTAPLTLTVTSGTVSQILVNPGFESGNTTWTASASVINTTASEAAHTGSWKAWLDGYGTTHTDTLYQQVAIFSTKTSATLTFWLHVDTAETSTTTAFDTMAVQIRNSSGTLLATLATYSNLDASSGYAQKTFDLSPYIGQTIRVYLTATEDSIDQTSFVVDDFALNVQ
jgi:hypothetical protein